jgi:hypothetical protein
MKDLHPEPYRHPNEELSWSVEASLVSASHVYCSGTLAQCVRRWTRLSNSEKDIATIKLRSREGESAALAPETVLSLSKRPDLAVH